MTCMVPNRFDLFCEKTEQGDREEGRDDRRGDGRGGNSFVDSFFRGSFLFTSWIHFFLHF